MQADRRKVLSQLARFAGLAGLVSLATLSPGITAPALTQYPFALGVASGAPLPNSMVLWTRLTANPFDPQPFSAAPVAVQWEIAKDEQFRKVASKGTATVISRKTRT